MKRQASILVLVVLLVLSILTGCSDSIDAPVTDSSGTGGGASGTLTSAQRQTIAEEFLIAVTYTFSLHTQPIDITVSSDFATVTFDNYALPSNYDAAVGATSFGIPEFIGTGSSFSGTVVQTEESETTTTSTIDMTVTDVAIPGGSVRIVMTLTVSTSSVEMTLTVDGETVDTAATVAVYSDLMDDDLIDYAFGITGDVEAIHDIGTTSTYSLAEDEIHWITFSASAGTTYTIQTSDVGDDLDTAMTLRNAGGDMIATNDDDELSLYSKITFTASASGTYYIGIIEYGGAAGSYQLSITTSE